MFTKKIQEKYPNLDVNTIKEKSVNFKWGD
jgi:hypothetical protein